ncbi:MAG: helix-turn-helix domain-containing protein [Chitinophagaceae bacterium]|nr:helix-turn-helix domain-containing protein [Chitinophagaceae bacterium]
MATVERNEIFDLAYRFITETQESIFLTGKAGTGKTTFLKYLKENSSKNMVIAAPTGVAAINAGGVTLHSLFQLPLYPFLPTEGNKLQLLQGIRYNKQRISLLRKIELLVIDEISMVRCDVLDAIDTILKSVRRNRNAAFGGVQLLFIGDLFQLPPVAKNEEWKILNQYYNSPFFFDSRAVKEQTPLLIELKTIYRQKEQSFVDLLNKVRNNQMDIDDYQELNERYIQNFHPALEDKYITLTSHNNQADNINMVKLQKLNAISYTYKARIEGEFPDNIYPAEAQMVLKEGTQVMFIKNDVGEKKYFNGKIGVIASLAKDKIMVNCDGEEIEVREEAWDNVRYTLNRSDEKLEQHVLGRFFQYPLRLAWAITIHKSQGLTFDKVMIDAASAFSSGQVYVALSRCTSLGGIVLLSKIPPTAIYSNEHVVAAHSSLVPKGSLAERFQGARQVFTVQLLSEIFLMDELQRLFNWLRSVLEKSSEKLNDETITWIQQFAEQLRKEKAIAQKFINHIPEFLQAEPVIENNQLLQKRIQDAAGYFLPLLQNMKQQLQQHPVVTEHKEAAAAVDEVLLELMATFIKTIHMVQFCKESFTVTGYLKHKLNLAIPRILISSYAANKKHAASSDIPNAELFYTLKNWRDRLCNGQDLPIYFVANNNSLKEIAAYLPLTNQHLQQLSGFGKAKADKYGEEIIEMVQAYCNQHNLETNIELKSTSPKRQRKEPSEKKTEKIPSAVLSARLHKEGKTIAEIAKERNLAASTIEGHLTAYIQTGEIKVDAFADETTVKIITEYISSNPEKSHSEIRAMLNNEYSFAQVRAVANHLLWLQNKTAVPDTSI